MNAMAELGRRLACMAEAFGATFFGVADLTLPRVHDFMAQQAGSDEVRRYPRSLALGIALANGIVDQLPRVRDLDDAAVAKTYWHHGYEVVNRRLDAIALRLANLLQAEGYRALPVPAAYHVDVGKHLGYVSNKLSAHLAGLGWIGKSCLVITPQVGPRARWATVLTDAPLTPGTPLDQRCGDCVICVETCPSQAFTGRNFVEDEPREARMIPQRCADHRAQRAKVLGEAICGMCVYICPYGHKGATNKV